MTLYNNFIWISFSGFGNVMSFEEFEDGDINRIETYSKQNLLLILDLTHNEYEREHLICLFGQFSSNPSAFMFLPDERELIHSIVNHIKKIVIEFGKVNVNQIDHFQKCGQMFDDNSSFKSNLSKTSIGLIFGEDIEPNYLQLFCNAANPVLSCEEDHQAQLVPTDSTSRTYELLRKFKATTDQNLSRKKPGYRYNIDIKQLAAYIRVLGGALLYETIHKNLELSLPSIDTTNRFIRKTHGQMVEGCLRTNELLQYLNDRNLELAVALSEDVTRISGRIEYDHRTNQISGFVLPLNKDTRMPIPYSFPARNRDEILKYFASISFLPQFC